MSGQTGLAASASVPPFPSGCRGSSGCACFVYMCCFFLVHNGVRYREKGGSMYRVVYSNMNSVQAKFGRSMFIVFRR